MAERMTSKADAAYMKHAIDGFVDRLERQDLTRGQIGAAMAGIGLALCCHHNGKEESLKIMDSIRLALEAGQSQSN